MNTCMPWIVWFLLCPTEMDLAMKQPELYKAMRWPAPTKELTALVEQMGDNHFRVREAASKQMREHGWKAMGALYKGIKHSDPEIQSRCRRIIDEQLSYSVKEYPDIFRFNEKMPFTANGKKFTIPSAFLKKIYMRRLSEGMNRWNNDVYYYNSATGKEASRELVQALVLMGVDKQQVEKACKEAESNSLDLPDGMYEYEGHGGGAFPGMFRRFMPPVPLVPPPLMRKVK